MQWYRLLNDRLEVTIVGVPEGHRPPSLVELPLESHIGSGSDFFAQPAKITTTQFEVEYNENIYGADDVTMGFESDEGSLGIDEDTPQVREALKQGVVTVVMYAGLERNPI